VLAVSEKYLDPAASLAWLTTLSTLKDKQVINLLSASHTKPVGLSYLK